MAGKVSAVRGGRHGAVLSVEVVCMVYRSLAFYEFMDDQKQIHRFVANDPEVDFLGADVYHDKNPQDHYLSRVYRCWNYCVESSKAEHVCLVNSDMAFGPGWLDALERRLDGHTLPVSRLVEPGFMAPRFDPVLGHGFQELIPGQHAIQIDLGRDPVTFRMDAWHRMAADFIEERVEPGGLFMPCIVHRDSFLSVGGYPEGNVRLDDGSIVSGDAVLFAKLGARGFKHVTCFDSLVYHMQEGEMSQ